MQQYPEILQEVLDIEAAIIKLTAATSYYKNANTFQKIKDQLGFDADDTKVISIVKPTYNWITYTGWAASVILAVGLVYTVTQKNQLQENIQIAKTQQSLLETQIANSKNSLEEANTLITVLRDDNITTYQFRHNR